MPDVRPPIGGHFTLDISGANAGALKRFDGMNMEADVVTNDLGPENIQKKQIANIRWTPAKATIGSGMSKELSAIVQRALTAQQKPFDGALHLTDANFKVQSSLTFTGAIMTSVTVPKLDGSSKDPAYFSLEWEAEQVRWVKGGGAEVRPSAPPKKALLCSNFRFEMGGLPCSRVATIDSFTWTCGIVREPMDGQTRRPGTVTVPNIKVDVSRADFEAWLQAATKWFIDGKHQEKHEMSGAIIFLAPDMHAEIGRVTLKNCGFARFVHGPFEASSDQIARFSCEFYVEAMEFALK